MEGDDRFKGTDIYEELKYLTGLYDNTDDSNSRKQIHDAADALRGIGDSGDAYTVIRSKTYISGETATNPISGEVFNANPNGSGLSSIDVKTLQYIVIDRDTNVVTTAGFVGQTINITTGETGRASVGGLSVTNYGKQLNSARGPGQSQYTGNMVISANVHAGDPLVKYAPKINDSLTFVINMTSGAVKLSGSIDGFPAHEVWVRSSGGSYEQIYSYNDGNIYMLGPVYGTQSVSGSYTP